MYVCGASGLKLVKVGEWRPERGGEPKGAVAVVIHRISIWMRSSDPNISIGRILWVGVSNQGDQQELDLDIHTSLYTTESGSQFQRIKFHVSSGRFGSSHPGVDSQWCVHRTFKNAMKHCLTRQSPAANQCWGGLGCFIKCIT